MIRSLVPIFLLLLVSTQAQAKSVFGLPLPSKARTEGHNVYVTPLSFHRTLKFYRARLKKKRIRHKEIPIYRFRGTTVARLLSEDPATPWWAIHVFRKQGRTYLAILPQPENPPPPLSTVDETAPSR